MAQRVSRLDTIDEYRRLLGMQIKLDVATALRHHPHLDDVKAQRAFARLTNEQNLDRLVTDLAYEEALAAIDRGESPAASMLRLAGFRPNPVGQC